MSFTMLNNGFYNFIGQALGLGTASNNLQLIQPTVDFPQGTTDAQIWSWMNQIPTHSLIQSGISGDQLFSDYTDVIGALTPSININFNADVGAACAAAWQAYTMPLLVANTLSPTQLPGLFHTWAMLYGYSSVAAKGSSDLAAMQLEPIYRAQQALMPYTPYVSLQTQQSVPGKAPDWSMGYAKLVSELGSAGGRSLTQANVQSNSGVTSSWAAGGTSGGFLLWGGSSSSSSSSLSTNFASQAVSASVTFDNALSFVPVPGAWYDSGVFGLSYAAGKNGVPPWNPSAPLVTWVKTFGPGGNMLYFVSGLIIVSGMKVTTTSSFAFSSSDQTTITQNSSAGFWPFYRSGSSSSVTTSHSFNQAGALTITSSSPKGVPILLGMIVMPANQYLGQVIAGRTQFIHLSSLLNLKGHLNVA